MIYDKKSSNKYADSDILPVPPSKWTPGFLALHVVFLVVSIQDIRAVLGFSSVNTALAFYGVYHREPLNQAIHFVGVPLILLTCFMAGAHVPWTSGVKITLPGTPAHYLNWATVWLVFYNVFYFSIDVVGAALYAPFLYLMYSIAIRLTAKDQQKVKCAMKQKNDGLEKPVPWTGTGCVLTWALRLHMLSWWIQIVPGHKLIEGAQPALMQSLGGAMTTAPLFAFYEGVWALGWRLGLRQNVLNLVDQYTVELCDKGVHMAACPP